MFNQKKKKKDKDRSFYGVMPNGEGFITFDGETYEGKFALTFGEVTSYLVDSRTHQQIEENMEEKGYFDNPLQGDQGVKAEIDDMIQENVSIEEKTHFLLYLLVAKVVISRKIEVSDLFYEQIRRLLKDIGFEKEEKEEKE